MPIPKSSSPYTIPQDVAVSGATAPNGKPYICVTSSGQTAWLPRSAFTGSGSEALKILNAANIPLLTSEWAQCRTKVAALTSYPFKTLIDRPGWNGEHFALPDGTVFSPRTTDEAVVLFPVNEQKCATAGSIYAWRVTTSLLKNQSVATFVLLAAYAGPFLALTNQIMNQGFEIAGPRGVGKSTVQRFAAAVCGPADNPLGLNYWVTADATINALERIMADHADMPLIMDEFNLYAAGENVAARARKFNELVFKLSNGSEKMRFGASNPQRSRFVFIASTNEPLEQLLLGHQLAGAEAAFDRLLTIPIGSDRPFGVFDSVPDKFVTSGQFAEHLNQAARKSYGIGIRHLLKHLVADLAKDPADVAQKLKESISYFRRQVGVDLNNGSETRVADAFGLVYAAGKFALRYKAISKHLDPLEATLACYRLNQTARSKPQDTAAQLVKLADDFDSLYETFDKIRDISDEEIEEARAIVREARGGQRELLLTDSQLKRFTLNTRAFFADPQIDRMLISENGRKQTKRRIRKKHKAERFYCFRLPPENTVQYSRQAAAGAGG